MQIEVEQWLDKIGAHVPAGNSAIVKSAYQVQSASLTQTGGLCQSHMRRT